MRMARAGTFPNEKKGRFRVARFGDVKQAFAARGPSPTAHPTGSAPAKKTGPEKGNEPDPLDPLRRKYGLKPRGE